MHAFLCIGVHVLPIYFFPYIDGCMAVCVVSVRHVDASSSVWMGADDGGGGRPRAGVARHTTAR